MADLVMVGAGPQALALSCLLLQKRSRLQRRLRPGERILADQIWLATGHRQGVSQQPLLQQLHQQHPIELVDDWPVLGPDLGWPGTLVHLMG